MVTHRSVTTQARQSFMGCGNSVIQDATNDVCALAEEKLGIDIDGNNIIGCTCRSLNKECTCNGQVGEKAKRNADTYVGGMCGTVMVEFFLNSIELNPDQLKRVAQFQQGAVSSVKDIPGKHSHSPLTAPTLAVHCRIRHVRRTPLRNGWMSRWSEGRYVFCIH